MSFTNIFVEDQRLVILRTLAEDRGYSMNESVLQQVLDMFGHRVSRDQVKAHLRWLEEMGLVTVEDACGVLVATLTSRGADVACGAAQVDGVKRPRPRG